MTNRKFIRISVYYILPILLLITSILTRQNYDIFRLFGRTAFYILLIIMFIKPVAVFINFSLFSILLSYRRELGHACIWFFLFHSIGMIISRELFQLTYFTNPKSFLFWGGLAAIGMFILLLTSNDWAIKILRKNWKLIQQVSYFVLFFTLIHVSLIRTGSFIYAFLIITLYLILKFFEYKKLHKKSQTHTKTKSGQLGPF